MKNEKSTGGWKAGNYIITREIGGGIIDVEKITEVEKEGKLIILLHTLNSKGVSSGYNQKSIENWKSFIIATPEDYQRKFEYEYKMCNMKIETHNIMVNFVKNNPSSLVTNKQTVAAKFKEITKFIKDNNLFIDFLDTVKTL